MALPTASWSDPDPLYDAPYLIFIYASWVAASYFFGDTAGLAVLVLATIALTGFALTQSHGVRPRSFTADFGVILLFCSASIGVGVFVVSAISTAPLLTIALASLALAGALLIDIVRRPAAVTPVH